MRSGLSGRTYFSSIGESTSRYSESRLSAREVDKIKKIVAERKRGEKK